MVARMFSGGFFSHGVMNLMPAQCFELCSKSAVIVDVREPWISNFKTFKVDRVLYLPFSELEKSYMELPPGLPLIFADSVGLRSREAVLFMIGKGYNNVANMAGGIVDWERDGLPLSADIGNRLSGSCMCQLKPREGKGRNK